MTQIDPQESEIKAVSRLVDFSGKSVVEVGAGDGRFTWRYAEQAKSVLAIEPQEAAVQDAIRSMPARLGGRVDFKVADATTFHYPKNRFDIAVLSYSL